MKLVLYCSHSVWPVKRKMRKKQIFLVGGNSALPMYYIYIHLLTYISCIFCVQERKGRGECRKFKGDELCLGRFPWKKDKGKVKIPTWRTHGSNKKAKSEILTPFHMTALSIRLRCSYSSASKDLVLSQVDTVSRRSQEYGLLHTFLDG